MYRISLTAVKSLGRISRNQVRRVSIGRGNNVYILGDEHTAVGIGADKKGAKRVAAVQLLHIIMDMKLVESTKYISLKDVLECLPGYYYYIIHEHLLHVVIV